MEYGRLLFNTGIVIIICCLLFGILCFVVLKSKARRLNTRLDEEYGERKKKRRPS